MRARVLLTGATGFLGTYIARELLRREDVELLVLVRADGEEAAARRLSRAWWDFPELAGEVGKRIAPVVGDVAMERLGMPDAQYDGLAKQVTHVVHAAAEVRIDAPAERLRLVNVQGTANVLELARAAHRDHGLARFTHISTAYVAGRRTGEVPEQDLTDGHGFGSGYERSKFEGERLVRQAGRDLPVTVLRPGMIVGDSASGYVRTFNTVYVPVRMYLTQRSRVLPVSPDLRLNIVPVDYVAGAAASLTFDPRAEGLTLHLTAPPEGSPTVRQLVTAVRQWARERAGMRLPAPVFIPVPALAKRGGEALGLLGPYLSGQRRFGRENTDRLLGPYALDWNEYLGRLLDFALYSGFLHRSGRTVHEQILFRLQSRGRPVRCFDIVDGRSVERPAADLRREMLDAAASLRAMGVRPGDRVAMVGLNSTRYLALDVAVGLAGAVSVPLYYTSPPAEIDGIIRASGARLLLVGAPKVLDRAGELSSDVAMVSFCRGGVPAAVAGRVMRWEEFMAKARGSPATGAAEAPVTPDDLATLRFTSGTTGFPKGVAFTHRGVQWMGEAVASLFPYEARSREITYLSFLPMNHVVEGILSTYSAFYAPAPLSIHFLEDFKALPRTLPEVRPTIFFSVPRVYERLWEGLRGSPAGRLYLRSGRAARRVLRGAVRRGLLRRAGLDRCAQLMVGSAPVGRELLEGLRELGVEVHNAYGLTEAPLVTLNRLGANRIGTTGQPLPRTEVRTAPDGEVLVRGPQVTRGYLGESEQPFVDGWLRTGDLGRMDGGYLVIEGRKKELLATSYGKKIQPGKIEGMLRSVPGVAEAMVVGEARPYCAAMIWVNEEWTFGEATELDSAIREINQRLSHPEQLRRWAVMPNDLRIERGELTSNLKLRRGEVLRTRAAVASALYDEAAPLPGVLHMGAVGRSA